MIDVVALGAIASPMFALKGPAMAKASYPPGGSEKQLWLLQYTSLACGYCNNTWCRVGCTVGNMHFCNVELEVCSMCSMCPGTYQRQQLGELLEHRAATLQVWLRGWHWAHVKLQPLPCGMLIGSIVSLQ
jgi:hypothetical protein